MTLKEPEAMPVPSADDLALAPLVGADLKPMWRWHGVFATWIILTWMNGWEWMDMDEWMNG